MRYIHRIVLLLTALAAAVLLAGCANSATLDDKGIEEYLNKCYGVEFKVTGQEERQEKLPGDHGYDSICLCSIEASDGTKFSLQKIWFHDYIGGHYEYTDNYLMQRIYDRPELYTELNDCGLDWEFGFEGFEIKARGYADLAHAAKVACEIVNRCGDVVQETDYQEENVVFSHIRPSIIVLNAPRKSRYDGYPILYSKTYDPDEVAAQLQESYMEDIKDGNVEEKLPESLLKKFGADVISVSFDNGVGELLKCSEHAYIDMGDEDTVYYLNDKSYDSSERKFYDFRKLRQWAAAAGFVDGSAEGDSVTYSDGKSTVSILLSDKKDCSVIKDGKSPKLQGGVFYNENYGGYVVCLTADDLCKLFDTELETDYLNGKAKVRKV